MDLHVTTDKLQIGRSSAADIDSVINWGEFVKATGVPVNFGSQRVAFASAATGDALDAPGANNFKSMISATWRNKHASLACDVEVILDQNATDFSIWKETLQPGETLEYIQGIGYFRGGMTSTLGDLLVKVLDADAAGQNIATVQPWFPSGGAVQVEAGTVYLFEGAFSSVRAAGATSHTTGISFGGTATLTSFFGAYYCGEGDVATLADADSIIATSAANLQVKAASTSTTEVIKLSMQGSLKVNAAGTFIPQFTYSAAPGGAPTIESNSYFKLIKLGAGFTTRGNWT
jgi:hypothetical protein